MKARGWAVTLCALVCGFAPYAKAEDLISVPLKCKPVNGTITWTVIPAPNDPFGRVLGTVTGSLEGTTTDIVNNLTFDPGTGTLSTQDSPVFLIGTRHILTGEAEATFTPIPDKPNLVKDVQTITITGGTGKYAGASGVIHAEGKGHDLFPSPTPGVTSFNLVYEGEVCVPKI